MNAQGVKTPKAEMDLLRKRLRAAEEHYDEWRTTQQFAEGGESSEGS